MLLFLSTEHVRYQQFVKIELETKQMRKNTQTMGCSNRVAPRCGPCRTRSARRYRPDSNESRDVRQQQSTLIAYSCILDCTAYTANLRVSVNGAPC